jgi:predicted nucleic acid-binding protein
MANSDKKLRVLTDANVLFAGSAFPRWPYEVLQHAAVGDFQLVLCPLIIDQAQRHLQKRFPEQMTRFNEFLRKANYELVSDPTPEDIEANKHLIRDLSDVAIALAAISAGVDYVISADKDFTVQDESTAELRRHVKILLSGTFLREVMGWTSEQLEAIRHRKWSDMPENED